MYSSLLEGVVTDPALMVIPLDDHVVHRGDGVFESVKFIAGAVYNLDAHLHRLEASAARIELGPAPSANRWLDWVSATLRASELADGLLRLLLTRGPGSFGANPYDCPRPSAYVIAYSLTPPPPEKTECGVSVAVSMIPARPPWLAQIKSCNYLPNVLMKKEARDRGVDYTIGFDDDGSLAEGATETVVVVDRHGRLAAPGTGTILAGTTLDRVLDLARPLVTSGDLAGIHRGRLVRDDLVQAREVLIVGTTIDVLAATTFAGRPVGSGRPGPIAAALRTALHDDIRGNRALRTEPGPPASA